MQAAPDHPTSINTHLTPHTNLSHFIGKSERFSSATANAEGIVPRQLVYIYTPAPMAKESSPMMMKEHKPKKGIKWRRRWIRFNYGLLLPSSLTLSRTLGENNQLGSISTSIVQKEPWTEETQEQNVTWSETWWFPGGTICSLIKDKQLGGLLKCNPCWPWSYLL